MTTSPTSSLSSCGIFSMSNLGSSAGFLPQPEQISQILVLGLELSHSDELSLVTINLFAVARVLTRQFADLLDCSTKVLDLANESRQAKLDRFKDACAH